MLNGKQDMTLQAHRGSYKTSCVSVAIAIMMITNPNRNILFMRKTDTDVIEIVSQVRRMLVSPYAARITEAMYGEPLALVRDNSYEIDTSVRHGASGASQLLGMGIGGSLTGKHAYTIITDDIVNIRDRVSRAERERTKTVYQELQNIRNPGGRIINAGTPWHKEDSFTLMPNIERYDCHSTGLLNAEQIAGLRASMTPSLFASNYELRHIATEDALFDTPPNFTPDVTRIYNGIAHIDAAYGGQDGSAFTIARKHGDTIYVLGKLRKTHIDNCLDEYLALTAHYKAGSIDTESNADKGYLAKEIRRRGGFANEPYHEGMNKFIKISTYLKRCWSRIVFLDDTDSDYINEILDYTEDAEHDDCADSLASIIRRLEKPSGIITSSFRM